MLLTGPQEKRADVFPAHAGLEFCWGEAPYGDSRCFLEEALVLKKGSQGPEGEALHSYKPSRTGF